MKNNTSNNNLKIVENKGRKKNQIMKQNKNEHKEKLVMHLQLQQRLSQTAKEKDQNIKYNIWEQLNANNNQNILNEGEENSNGSLNSINIITDYVKKAIHKIIQIIVKNKIIIKR